MKDLQETIWHKLHTETVFLDGTDHPLLLERQEIFGFYFPLAKFFLKHCRADQRTLVAVAGPPGCGKTAFAATLRLVINAIQEQDYAVAIGMDGWHFPNAYLDNHTVEWNGQPVSLRKLKGSPETFDQDAIQSFLNNIRRKETLAFPVYSRQTHDPIPEGGQLKPSHRMVILEGNYWLLNQAPWRAFQKFFDFSIMLKASPESLLDALRNRHLRGGKTSEWVEEHLQQIDRVNIELVLSNSIPADIVVEKRDSYHIKHIDWLKSSTKI